MEITILNWDKFNPRKDVKVPTWFRLGHSLFEDPQFYDFSHSEICAWVYFLSICSKKNTPTISINFAHAKKIARLSKKTIETACEKLNKIGVISFDHVTHTLRVRDVDDTSLHATNSTNEHNITDTTRARDVHAVSEDEIRDCLREWKTTLDHFEIGRGPGIYDQDQIARAAKRFGVEWVRLAFIGARKQQPSKSWNPKQYVSLMIYLDPKRIERLVNIGAGKESIEGIDWGAVFGKAS